MRTVYVGEMFNPDQPRVLMFVHDGRGLGHLRRLSRIAREMQDECAILFVTGHRAASWLVPERCEFVHIPSHDSLDPKRSRNWGRVPFWSEGLTKGRTLRNALLQTVIDGFRPNAIVMDYLPMGIEEEMYPFIANKGSARCYFLLRGVLDSQQRVNEWILNDKGRYLLEEKYDRVVVMCDPRIVDVEREYGFSPIVGSKVSYAGYVAEPISVEAQFAARMERNIKPGDKWVVCSAGGGHQAEDIIRNVYRLAQMYSGVYFDIIVGPRSALDLPALHLPDQRVRVTREHPMLATMHAACDVVICTGGYNSLMEAVVGQARIIVVPIKGDHEQPEHAKRLAKFAPISLVEDLSFLPDELERALSALGPAARQPLELSGAATLKSLILEDLKGNKESDVISPMNTQVSVRSGA